MTNIPLDELIDCKKNIYELTCVAIKEAEILSSCDKGKEIEMNNGKIVSEVLNSALKGEIKYTPAGEKND